MRLPLRMPIEPMEALSVDEIPVGAQWQYEPKWDGFRCVAFRDGEYIELQSKSGRSIKRYFPEVAAALLGLTAKKFVLDGEIAIPADGGFSFDDLLQRIHPAPSRVNKLAAETPALFILFDLLVDTYGHSLMRTDLDERRRGLEAFFRKYCHGVSKLRLSPATTKAGEAKRWLKKTGATLDGIIAKRRDLPYQTGERDTLEAMAEATRSRGYEYFGVADHSKSAHYAGGLSVDEIAEQQVEADALNKKYRGTFRIFKGIESDILPDGSLDYPHGVLTRFDFIVASVHGQFKMDRAAQTERIIRAVSNPHTTILGHMTGRQLLRRPGYDLDIEKVLAACAEHGVAVEINANPWRLDLDWRWHETALKLGCMMSINPDAHSTREIDLTHWGIEMARKGGVPKDRVLNCLKLEEFSDYLAKRRKQRNGRRYGPRPANPRIRAPTAAKNKASLAGRKRKSDNR
jgi:histidinol phosphatase-like PHP family hydrolase